MKQLKGDFPSNDLPTMPAPYNIMWTTLNLTIDYVASAAMQRGGSPTAIAALARENVTARTMFVVHSMAVEVATIPKKYMLAEINKNYEDSKGAYDKCNTKLKRVCTNIMMKEVNAVIAKWGVLSSANVTPTAMAESFFLRLTHPVDGWIATGKEPDLKGLEKGDLETENSFLNGQDISSCTFSYGGILKSLEKEWFLGIVIAYASSIERAYAEEPNMFNLDRLLFYDEATEGAPHDENGMKLLRQRKHKRKEVSGTEMEYFANTTGTVKTNGPVDVSTPKLKSFIPHQLSITTVFDEKIFGQPNEGYRPSIGFLRDNFLVNGKRMTTKKASPKKESPSERAKSCVAKTNERLGLAISDGTIEEMIKKSLPKSAAKDSVVKQLANSFKGVLQVIKEPTDEVLNDLSPKKAKRKRDEGEQEERDAPKADDEADHDEDAEQSSKKRKNH
jgi:hypothetical protein